jgi:uncharacterized protein (DUF1499 family)
LKIIIYIIAGLFALIIVYLSVKAHMSRAQTAPELTSGELIPCPDSPNCVCSESGHGEIHQIDPIALSGNLATEAMPLATKIITKMGGRVLSANQRYISATFSTGLFGFVDDVQFRANETADVIHVRSSSRVGRGDLGANRKRIEEFRKEWALQNSPTS